MSAVERLCGCGDHLLDDEPGFLCTGCLAELSAAQPAPADTSAMGALHHLRRSLQLLAGAPDAPEDNNDRASVEQLVRTLLRRTRAEDAIIDEIAARAHAARSELERALIDLDDLAAESTSAALRLLEGDASAPDGPLGTANYDRLSLQELSNSLCAFGVPGDLARHMVRRLSGVRSELGSVQVALGGEADAADDEEDEDPES